MAFGLGSILGLLSKTLGGKSSGNFLFGDKPQEKQMPRFTPEQEEALSQLLQQGLGETDFSGIENLAMKRFQEETIPSIAERFTGMGGGQRSSAFQSALGRAGADLEAQLGALKPQFGMKKLALGLQPRFDMGYTPGSKGALQGISGQLGSMLPMLLNLF